MKKFWKSLRMPAMKINKNKKILKRKKTMSLKKKSSRNHVKMRKYVIFVKNNLKANI